MSADATAQQRRLGTGFRTHRSEKPNTIPFGPIRLARRYETGLLIPRVLCLISRLWLSPAQITLFQVISELKSHAGIEQFLVAVESNVAIRPYILRLCCEFADHSREISSVVTVYVASLFGVCDTRGGKPTGSLPTESIAARSITTSSYPLLIGPCSGLIRCVDNFRSFHVL
jgi:hypothetical protein